MKRRTKCIGAAVLSLAIVFSTIPCDLSVAAASTGDYSFIQDYTLGWSGGVAVYEGGVASKPVGQTDVKVYSQEGDNPFEAQIDQAWDEPNLRLSQPVQYTTSDGKVHPVESMLTNFDFIADPTAIDNSGIDGKLYVYGTTEAFSYEGGTMVSNKYANHSLTILSTSDMVNWTDEGFMDSQNLTNEPSYSDNKVRGGFTSGNSWAPSGLKIDVDGDGDNEYYIFYTNGGATGYVMSESPTGPWTDIEGKALFDHSTPNCSDCNTCFDPAVLVDDKGDAYVYFGGLTRTSGRACKVVFDPVTGKVSRDGDPVRLPTYAMFEDNEINQFNGKYYYSYCTDYNSQSLTKGMSIAVYVSSDPLDIAFEPDSDRNKAFEPFTDEVTGVYHHFLGTVLDNPSVIYGQTYNNHHHMQSFKGHDYIFYHSTVLNNSIHRYSQQYRNLHVDEINIDPETDNITIEPSYEGAEQIENFDPYRDYNGKEKYINATTTSYSAGVKSTRDDEMVLYTMNGSPMVLDEIDTGDWTKIQGVDFGGQGLAKVEAEIKSATNEGAIEVFVDDPTQADNMIASIPVSANDQYEVKGTDISKYVTGVHDVYFVFRGSDYTVASWKFTEAAAGQSNPDPGVQQPSQQQPVQQSQQPLQPQTPVNVKVGNVNYAVDAYAQTVKMSDIDKTAKKAVIPDTVTISGKEYPVTEIAAKAFAGNKKLKSITVGKNVKTIGTKAFYKCSALKKITIKSTVLKKVGKSAFKGINAKAKIKVPKKKLKSYRKLLEKKGQSKSVKIVK